MKSRKLKMPQNEFKPFAVASNAAVLGQAEYETSQALREGFRRGLARSVEVNKAIRQASSIAAAVAEFTAEKSGKDMLDNGEVSILKENLETALSAVSSLLIAEVQGTSDVLSASFSPELRELKNGTLVHVRANEKNRTKTPVFKANEIGEKVIIKGNNLSLEEGDIAGAGHWLELQYDEALDRWVLQNPAKGITPSSGVPVGTIGYFAMAIPPAGYLKADGTAVRRGTYPDLFAAVGTIFGEGDGEITFNLPDLIDQFAQGSSTPGQKIAAGLPNIEGDITNVMVGTNHQSSGAFLTTVEGVSPTYGGTTSSTVCFNFSADKSNEIYGKSKTVQPSSLTLLPCIKAFDAVTNPVLIDMTDLANEMAGKVDKIINGKNIEYVIDSSRDGNGNWYRKWSDGWLEQGGTITGVGSYGKVFINFHIPFSDTINICFSQAQYFNQDWYGGIFNPPASAIIDLSGEPSDVSLTGCSFPKFSNRNWFACGY